MTTTDLRDLQRASRRIMARAFLAWCRIHFARLHSEVVALAAWNHRTAA